MTSFYDVQGAFPVFANPKVSGAELKRAFPAAVRRTMAAFPGFKTDDFGPSRVEARFAFKGGPQEAYVRIDRSVVRVNLGARARARIGWPAPLPPLAARGDIMLPAVDDLRMIPRIVALDWLAFGLHECMHVMLTNNLHEAGLSESGSLTYDGYHALKQTAVKHGTNATVLYGMVNAFEDPRIELTAIRHGLVRGYPAVAVNLVARFAEGMDGQTAKTARQFASVVAYAGRAWLPPALRAQLRLCCPPPYRAMLDDYCGRIVQHVEGGTLAHAATLEGGTLAMLRLVDAMLDDLKKAQALQPPPQPPQPPQDAPDAPEQPADDGAPQDGDEGDADAEGDDDGAPQDGDADAEGDDGEPGDDDGEGDDDGDADGDDGEGDADADADGDDGEGEPGDDDGEGDADGDDGEGEGADGAEDETGEGDADDAGEGEGDDGAEGEGDPGDSTDDDGDADPSTGRGCDPDPTIDADADDPADPLAPMDMQAPTDAPLDPTGKDRTSTADQVGGYRDPRARLVEAADGDVQAFMTRARQQPGAPRIGGVLRELLNETERTEHERGLRSGRIHRTALPRAMAGAENVFQRRERYGADASAMAMAIDASGSMIARINGGESPRRIDCANAAAMMIADALRGAQGSRSLIYYYGPVGSNSPAERADKYRPEANFGALHGASDMPMRVVKDWNETLSVAMRRMLGTEPGGGTPIVQAMQFGMRELVKQRAGRRVLVVMTDADSLPAEEVKEACADATRRGVAVVGIGIAADVGHLFPFSISVSELADLGGLAMRTVIDAVRRAFPATGE